MENYNIIPINSNLYRYKKHLVRENTDLVSNSVLPEESPQQNGSISKEYANATRAIALTQISQNNNLNNLTLKEYISKLMSKNKIPNKDFYVELNEYSPSAMSIIELNSQGKRVKETCFGKIDEEGDKDYKLRNYSLYNQNTQKPYKQVELHNGYVFVSNNNPVTGNPISNFQYNPDGTLSYFHNYITGKVSGNKLKF